MMVQEPAVEGERGGEMVWDALELGDGGKVVGKAFGRGVCLMHAGRD